MALQFLFVRKIYTALAIFLKIPVHIDAFSEYLASS